MFYLNPHHSPPSHFPLPLLTQRPNGVLLRLPLLSGYVQDFKILEIFIRF